MGLFDNENKGRSRDEVRVNVPENTERGSRSRDRGESKLKSEVESKVTSSSSGRSTSGSDIDLEDIHRQNERIIELLEQISGEEDSGRSNRSKKQNNDDNIGSGMNELL